MGRRHPPQQHHRGVTAAFQEQKSFIAKVAKDTKETNSLTAKDAEDAKGNYSFTAKVAKDAKKIIYTRPTRGSPLAIHT